MNILFLVNGAYLPQVVGGSEWSVHHFAKGLQRAGHSVAVLAQLRNSGFLGLRNKVRRRLNKVAFPADSSMGYPTFRGWDLYQGLNEIADCFRPEVVVVAGSGTGPVPLCIQAMKMGLKLVYAVMDVSFDHHGGDLRALKGAHFIANSEFTRRRLLNLYGIPSVVIHPPIDVSRCRATSKGKKVVMVNLRESKGGAVALAIAEARKNIPFAFYESWSGNTSSLKTRARESGNVEWNSAVLDPRKIYNNARILLVPSQAEEAWGMVASEAQCSGIPVIGSDIGGLTEAIGSGGIKISPEAPIATWLDTVDRLWSDDAEWQRVSDAALAYARRSEIQLENQISILEALICLQSVPQGFSFTLNDSQLGTHLDSC